MRYEVIRKKKFWWHSSFVLLLCQSACSLSISHSLQTIWTDPPRLPAFLQQPDYFRSFDKWLLSSKRMKKPKNKRKNWNPSESFMALTFLCADHTLYYPSFQLIRSNGSLWHVEFFTHIHTQTQMRIPGSMVVISLALGVGMTSWGRRR